jgi:hypothetical protein
MRKRYRVLVLAALAAALVVPVGFALSLEAPVPVHAADAIVGTGVIDSTLDGAKLLLVGATLFGLAAFVRKTV